MDNKTLANLKIRILRELAQNKSWQFKTDDNFWICPYCGLIGSHNDVPDKMLSEVLGHFMEVCPEWGNENKVELSIQTLENIKRAKNWLRNQGKKENFRYTDSKLRWYCPYCAQRQKIFVDLSNPSTSQVCEIVDHIDNCPEQNSGKPPLDAEYIELAVNLRRDKRFSYYNSKDDSWFSPWILKLTGIKLDTSKKITRNQVVATAAHYQQVCESFGENVKPAMADVIERSLKEEREKEHLLTTIQQNIFKNEVWQVLSERNLWICPYCRKEIKGVDFKTVFGKKEIAPQQIFIHLTESCIKFKTGKEPVEKVEELAPNNEQIRKTPYHQSLTTFLSLVEGETVDQIKAGDDGSATDLNINDKRDEYNRIMLEKAKNVQLQMLPKLPELPGLEFAVYYKSCDELSGDFYDFFDVSDHELGIVVGDVSGHGVTAALVMAATKKTLKITGKNRKPKETMLIVNDELKNELPMATFVTVFYGVLNLKTFELCYVRAGHNALYIFNKKRKPKFNEYMAKGMIIGTASSKMLETVIEEETIQLYRGDLVVQYTDGVTEAMNPEREEYGDDRLINFVKDNNALNANEFVSQLAENVEQFYDGAEPNDDVTIVTLKIP